MEELPTPMELMAKTGIVNVSVAYGHSRVIKNYLDVPVVAYGIGFNGFVCVIRIRNNVLKSYSYGGKHPLTRYTECGFAEIELDKAMEAIRENKFICEKGMNDDAIKNAYQKPVVATLEYDKRTKWGNRWYNWSRDELRLVRLRNGKLSAEMLSSYYNKFRKCNFSEFIKEAKKEEGIYEDAEGSERREIKNISKNIPDEILQEAKDQSLIEDI